MTKLEKMLEEFWKPGQVCDSLPNMLAGIKRQAEITPEIIRKLQEQVAVMREALIRLEDMDCEEGCVGLSREALAELERIGNE